MLSRLNKLKSLTLDEAKDRGRQYLQRKGEAIGVSRESRGPADKDILESFLQGRFHSPLNLLEYFRNGERTPLFFLSPNDRESIVSEVRKLSGESERIVAEADELTKGKFELLGYPELSFGEPVPDWHLEPISNSKFPLIHFSKINEVDGSSKADKKIVWELNRHQYFAQLGQAYWLTEDEKYARTFVQHIENWMDNNPPKMGLNWLSSLEISFRSMSWIWALQFFILSPAFAPELLLRILKHLVTNGRHIRRYLSTYFSPNTHLTGEALGLFILGAYLPEFNEAKEWRACGRQILLDALDFQVRPDGSYCEQSSHYTRYTVDFYLAFLILLQKDGSGDAAKIQEHLGRLLDGLLYTSYPNGESVNFGDDDGGRLHMLDGRSVLDLRPVFALGSVLLDRGDLKQAAGDARAELPCLLGAEGIRAFETLPAARPVANEKAFPDGGVFTARSDWTGTASFIAIDCGPHGFLNGGHAHADALSFVYALRGQPIFIDSGTYKYASEPDERDLFRSTSSHNCLTVDGESSSIPAGPFSWRSAAESRLLRWEESEEGWRFRGTHDGYRRLGVAYEREISMARNGELVITEFIDCEEARSYEINFILSPDFLACESGDGSEAIVSQKHGKPILSVATSVSGDLQVRPKWNIHACYVSPIYGKKTRSSKLIMSCGGKGAIVVTNRVRLYS